MTEQDFLGGGTPTPDKPPMNWFSNFIPLTVPYYEGGICYRTPEHYYQAQKARFPAHKALIAALDTPGQAKRAGAKLDLREGWPVAKILVMTRIQTWRFETDPELRLQLIMCETTDQITEWNTWHDNFWGICQCSNCLNRDEKGLNMLGRILMDIRSNIVIANPELK